MKFIFIISLFAVVSSQNADWNYEELGPETWPSNFEQCGGQYQSPINIDCRHVVYKKFKCLKFKNYGAYGKVKIVNLGGRTIEIVPYGNTWKFAISRGNLNGTYVFVQGHFHWGTDNYKGSEHTFQNEQFPLELHLVHRHEKYRDIEEAQRYPDGIVVIAILFKIDGYYSSAIEIISRGIGAVRYANQTKILDVTLPLEELMPPTYCYRFFRYFGSLTTPSCNEAVTWLVLSDTSSVTVQQLERFRRVLRTAPGQPEQQLRNNFRPTQPLNGRIIESNRKKCNIKKRMLHLADEVD